MTWLLLAATLLGLANPPRAWAQPSMSEYASSTVMIPMRDGVKLKTVVWRPKKQSELLPILLDRTPYDADAACRTLFATHPAMVKEGYLIVAQDLRGKFGSEGQFVMLRPTHAPTDDNAIDETTDAYDTMDWLVANLADNNGRVGMLGISYDGWTTMMALLDPHPAFKAASPQASPDDMFLGDDFHHNGAFRLSYGFEYVAAVDGQKFTPFAFDQLDTYDWFLHLGGLANVDAKYFHLQKPMWTTFASHHAFDDYWQSRKVIRHLSEVTVPTLTVAGWWDQEDFYGPLTIYEKMEALDIDGLNYLVVGPWNHGGWETADGSALGPIKFGSATSRYYRDSVEAPWFAYWLKDKGTLDLPEALTFRPGTNSWQRHDSWPPKSGVTEKHLYLSAKGKLGWDKPSAHAGADSYVSDPAHPVPYRVRPIAPMFGSSAESSWPVWQVDDQRHSRLRTDVLSYETDSLTEDTTICGKIQANLFASTTGSDSDWIVKLIDGYPDDAADAALAGYQLMVAGDVFRGRFQKSFETPAPLVPNQVTPFTIDLHAADYTFLRGHKIMVQVQSSWFPLIDRNPQKFVPNIFDAKDSDYTVATQTVHRSAEYPTNLTLSLVTE